MNWAPLDQATGETRFGGKAARLCVALRAGLPVPPGVALDADLVQALASADADAMNELTSIALPFDGAAAVRASAIGEDSRGASFAGQHATLLNVASGGLAEAVRTVWRSLSSPGALAYRRRLAIEGPPRMGVVIQQLVRAEVAGVLFTRHPINRSAQRVIEASWGLGKVVADGRVIPDRYRVAIDGELIELVPGNKQITLGAGAAGGTIEASVEANAVSRPCLTRGDLTQLSRLAHDCERVFGTGQDLEWALSEAGPHLLQVRPMAPARDQPGQRIS